MTIATTVSVLLLNPALPRAVVIGAFGGAGLTLTALYSRRGPMIYPVYAGILAALALLLARFPDQSYASRLVACLVGFSVASAALYVTTGILSRRGRERLVKQGRLPASALTFRLSLGGHAWQIAFLLAVGTLASAGVAFSPRRKTKGVRETHRSFVRRPVSPEHHVLTPDPDA